MNKGRWPTAEDPGPLACLYLENWPAVLHINLLRAFIFLVHIFLLHDEFMLQDLIQDFCLSKLKSELYKYYVRILQKRQTFI